MTGAFGRRYGQRRSADRLRTAPAHRGRSTATAKAMQRDPRILAADGGTAPNRRGERGEALGILALLGALALVVLPAVLAIADSHMLSMQRDTGWLGSPVMRFAALQTLAMAIPLLLGLVAAVRNRGRAYAAMAVLVAVFGNFLLLRTVLALVVTAVLV